MALILRLAGVPMSLVDDLERGRSAVQQHTWDKAFALLSSADARSPLQSDDLEALAECAYLSGRTDECIEVRRRGYTAHLQAGNPRQAAMCAYWLHVVHTYRGDQALGAGWLARAQRLLRDSPDCLEHGYILAAGADSRYFAGDMEGSLTLAQEASAIGNRFGEPDLTILGMHVEGRALLGLGRVAEGLVLFDEAMVAVIAGELSPAYTVWIYCSSIVVCQDMSDLGRAREWTAALERWSATQVGARAISGSCHLHRAKILHGRGAWADAEREARQTCEQSAGVIARDVANALYQIGEIRRLVGDWPAAEEAFGQVGRLGWSAQPGLALLRLAQGRTEAAATALRRSLAEQTGDRMARARILPAQVEVSLAASDLETARTATGELEAIAHDYGTPALRAAAAQARGAVRLAEGETPGALGELRAAWRIWQELDMPYEVACVRRLMGTACRALGDEDATVVELDAARHTFQRLGAEPDLRRTQDLLRGVGPSGASAQRPLPDGLTTREVEVLRLVAAGKSNQAIAAELVVSQKTVGRHLSNIFTKIRVSSRAAATAYAYEHDLI